MAKGVEGIRLLAGVFLPDVQQLGFRLVLHHRRTSIKIYYAVAVINLNHPLHGKILCFATHTNVLFFDI